MGMRLGLDGGGGGVGGSADGFGFAV
jgi:hypothetical protein